MTTQDITTLYEQQIKPLPRADQLLLLARIADGLAMAEASHEQELNLLELEGIGADIWSGVDAQHYINELRDEWDTRS